MKSDRTTDIWVGVFLNQLDDTVCTATVKSVTAMPDEVDSPASNESAALDLNHSPVPQLTNRTIGYPMERVTLVHYFELSREEDRISMRLKEGLEYFFRGRLTRVRRALSNWRPIVPEIVVVRQASPDCDLLRLPVA